MQCIVTTLVQSSGFLVRNKQLLFLISPFTLQMALKSHHFPQDLAILHHSTYMLQWFIPQVFSIVYTISECLFLEKIFYSNLDNYAYVGN